MKYEEYWFTYKSSLIDTQMLSWVEERVVRLLLVRWMRKLKEEERRQYQIKVVVCVSQFTRSEFRAHILKVSINFCGTLGVSRRTKS
jgi:hypothetical protein